MHWRHSMIDTSSNVDRQFDPIFQILGFLKFYVLSFYLFILILGIIKRYIYIYIYIYICLYIS
jgi:hypothetical protein